MFPWSKRAVSDLLRSAKLCEKKQNAHGLMQPHCCKRAKNLLYPFAVPPMHIVAVCPCHFRVPKAAKTWTGRSG